MVLKKIIVCVIILLSIALPQASALNIALVSDLHYGNAEGDGSANDILATINWLKAHNPDYVFIIGDITDDSDPQSWDDFYKDYYDLLNSTNISGIYFVLGGSHDGFEDSACLTSYNGGQDYGWNGLAQMRRFGIPPLYTIEIGNNVFIFINHMDVDYSKFDMDWGVGTKTDPYQPVIPQIWIDWLEEKLKYYSNKNYNIFVISHQPLNDTNQKSHTWWGMQDPSWQKTSSKLKELFEKYGVDVYISGHVHSDPSDIISDFPAHSGKVVFGKNYSNLPNTTFIQTGVVCWEHGVYRTSNYPSLYLMTLQENATYAELVAYNVATDEIVGISYDDSSTLANKLTIPLRHPIKLDGFNYTYEWIPYRVANEGVDVQWIKDSSGLMANGDTWFEFVWHWSKYVTVNNISINYTAANGSISLKYYVSDDGTNWTEVNLPYAAPTQWFKVNATISVISPPLFIRNIRPEVTTCITSYTPASKNIITKIYSTITFSAKFALTYPYEWLLNGTNIYEGISNETSVTVTFNNTGTYHITLVINGTPVITWVVKVFRTVPVFEVHYQKIISVKNKLMLNINITNIKELYDYEIAIDTNMDGIPDITTKNLTIDLCFNKPSRYKILVKVIDPISNGYNTTIIYVQVISDKLYYGMNAVNATGYTTYAETPKEAHVTVRPIKVSKDFIVIVNHENIYASNPNDTILNITFVGLAGGDKVWLNETVMNTSKVDLYHNGEKICTIPVKNNSVNITLTSYSTYLLTVNKSTIKKEDTYITQPSNIVVLLIIIITVLSTIALLNSLKNSAKTRNIEKFRFFKRF